MIFPSFIGAGFECAQIGNRNIAEETEHTPNARMREHYVLAAAHGCKWARDGVWPALRQSAVTARFHVAYAAMPLVIWDLCHYWEIENPKAWAHIIANAHNATDPARTLWICPVNEATFHGVMRPGENINWCIYVAELMIDVLRQRCRNVQIITSEPSHHLDSVENQPLHNFADDLVGINIHACYLQSRPCEIFKRASELYGDRYFVSETSLHCGHSDKWLGMDNRAEWLRYLMQEIKLAEQAGAKPPAGVCWHPYLDSPDWNDPQLPRPAHRVINDQELSVAITQANNGIFRI